MTGWNGTWSATPNGCAFCPVDELLSCGDEVPLVEWDEESPMTGRTYRNYDSLVTWVDGSRVHLQQSVDITALVSANTDELTGMLSRRAGKERLGISLARAANAWNYAAGSDQSTSPVSKAEPDHDSCRDEWVLQTLLRQLSAWEQNGFTNAKGESIKYRSGWEQLANLIKIHTITIAPGRHAYSAWLQSEMEKMERGK